MMALNKVEFDMIQQIAHHVGEIHSEQARLIDACRRHDMSLYGNGQPGLCQRMDSVQTRQKDCPARQAGLIQSFYTRIGLYIGITSIGIAALALILAYMR